jgi:hypothetical protein
MAASISMRVQYTGEPGEHTAVLSLENGHIRLDDFLYATKLSFARTGAGELVCANQARNVEGRFLGEGLLVVGPKIKRKTTITVWTLLLQIIVAGFTMISPVFFAHNHHQQLSSREFVCSSLVPLGWYYRHAFEVTSSQLPAPSDRTKKTSSMMANLRTAPLH